MLLITIISLMWIVVTMYYYIYLGLICLRYSLVQNLIHIIHDFATCLFTGILFSSRALLLYAYLHFATIIYSFYLQPDRVTDFCKRNKLQLIIRAHECVMDGFERFAQGQLITLFSATNYCGK